MNEQDKKPEFPAEATSLLYDNQWFPAMVTGGGRIRKLDERAYETEEEAIAAAADIMAAGFGKERD